MKVKTWYLAIMCSKEAADRHRQRVLESEVLRTLILVKLVPRSRLWQGRGPER